MKYITEDDYKNHPKKVWDELENVNELIITNKGTPVVLLTPLSDLNIEETLNEIRRAKAIVSLDKMWKTSVKNRNHKLSKKEINGIIDTARKVMK
ncbi:MAG: type II toxin-antitoxin system Phd/YefM family antitoxin [Ignavibacteria bacterium]|nr:type II toxin-antitoxin system Phd/YefM family antitoxin [Ignavibacteria bacterium]